MIYEKEQEHIRMNNCILVVAAHPDDEVLGAGAAIKKYISQGAEAYCVILGEGMMSRDENKDNLKELHENSKKALGIIGFKNVYYCDFPDNSFDTVSLLEITKKIERFLSEIKPDILFTHYENDLNIDHRITFRAVITACRPCNPVCPKEIYSFEVLSSTEWQLEGQKFNPDVYIDVKEFLPAKIDAMNAYVTEQRKYPHPRSEKGIITLANYRGMEAGFECAEAFKVVRIRK